MIRAMKESREIAQSFFTRQQIDFHGVLFTATESVAARLFAKYVCELHHTMKFCPTLDNNPSSTSYSTKTFQEKLKKIPMLSAFL